MTRHTRTRTALVATIALVMTLIATVPAFAASADLHRVGVTVYDLEGGKTPTLVIFASLAEEVTLPATVELPIPADVTLGWVGEVFPDPSFDTIAEYTLREEAGYDVLVITVNSSRAVQAELTVPDAWLIAGGQYLGIAMSWTANQDLAGVRLGFEVSDSFHAEELQPANASGARSSVGVLYSAETTPVAEGDTLTLSATVVPGAEGTHVVQVQTYLSDSNPWNDTARVEFEATPVRGLSGAVMDAGDSTGIEAEVFFHLNLGGASSILDSIATDDMGCYSIDLPCFAYDVEIRPEFPYWAEVFDSIEVVADGCNLRNFPLERADMAVIEDDIGAEYLEFYQFSFDTIGATYRIWNRDSLGEVPEAISGEMRRHTIFWFTGNDSSTTLDSSDIASLSYILANGGNIVLSGQGIMEDLHDNPAFLDLIGAEWLSADGSPVMNGVSGDPISGDLGQIMLLGGGSAGNQRHQDRLTPIAPAEGFLTYSTGSGYAGVRYEHPTSGGKIVFCAFGIEGVPYPAVSSAFTDRIGLIDAILKWFDPTYDVAERELPNSFAISAYPNPFNSSVTISVGDGSPVPQSIEIYDVSGRRVDDIGNYDQPVIARRVQPDEAISYGCEKEDCHGLWPRNDNANAVVWRPDESLPSGVYLVRASQGSNSVTKRVVYLK